MREFGPEYTGESRSSALAEPFFVDVDNDASLRGFDAGGSWRCRSGLIERPDIAAPEGAIVLGPDGRTGPTAHVELARRMLTVTAGHRQLRIPYRWDTAPSSIQMLADSVLLALPQEHIVTEVSPFGTTLWQFGRERDPGPGDRLLAPRFVEIAPDRRSYFIADTLNARVLQVDSQGVLLWQYGHDTWAGSIEGRLWRPRAIRPRPDGSKLIADAGNNRILRLSRDGVVETVVGHATVASLSLSGARSVQELPDRRWLVANTLRNEVVIIDPLSSTEERILTCGHGLQWPRCALHSVDDNEILIADGRGNRLVFADSQSSEIKDVLDHYTYDGRLWPLGDPHHVVFGAHGCLLVTLSLGGEIVEMTRHGECRRRWTGLNDPHSAFYVDNDRLLIANSGANTVLLTEADGRMRTFGSVVLPDGRRSLLRKPRMALPWRGSILIADSGAHRFLLARVDGDQMSGYEIRFETRGSTATPINRFLFPRWITPTASGSFLISDTGNGRVLEVDLVRSSVARVSAQD